MSILGIFAKSAASEAADHLLFASMRAAREPALFGDGRIPDTLDGRFEAVAALATLTLVRLKTEPGGDKAAQIYADRLFRLLDAGLREAGVGDLSVAKRMKALAGAFYGRLAAYSATLGDDAALAQALGRNIWNDDARPYAAQLAQRLRALHARHTQMSLIAFCQVDAWTLEA